jgi:tetratricopeptide (TPR) repeat protein
MSKVLKCPSAILQARSASVFYLRIERLSCDAVTELSLVETLNGPAADLVFLCGAGISVPPPSGLPTVAQFLREAVAFCRAGEDVAAALLAVSADPARAPRFEVLIDEIRKWNDPALTVARVFDSVVPNRIHAFLAARCLDGAAVITTNFDLCIESAAGAGLRRIVFAGRDLRRRPPITNVLVKPHGSHGSSSAGATPSLLITIAGLAETAGGFRRLPGWGKYLERLIRRRELVILGYSCSDAFDIMPVLLRSRPRQLILVDYDPGIASVCDASIDLAMPNARALCAALPSRYMRGQIERLLPAAATDPLPRRTAPTVRECLEAICTSPSHRRELLNLLLLVHNLNHRVAAGRSTRRSTETLLQVAKAKYRLSRYESTFRLLEQASNLPHTDRQYREYLYYRASTLYHIGGHAEAYAIGRHHYAVTKRTGDSRAIQFSLNNLGGLATGAGRDCRSRAHYMTCLRLTESVPNLEAEATAHWGLGDLFARERRRADALREYRAALAIHQSLGNRIWAAYLIRNIGEVFVDHHDFERAQEQLSAARLEFQDLDSGAGKIWTAYSFAKLAYLTGDDERCRHELIEAFSLIGSGNLFPVVPELIAVAALLAVKGELGPLQLARRKFRRKLAAAGPDDARAVLASDLLLSSPLSPGSRAEAYQLAFIRGE